MSGFDIHVVAGALFDADGRVLIAQRPPGKHMAGGWEFPGGKLEKGEEPFNGLVRELHEELAIEVLTGERIVAYTHRYANRSVYLDLWHVILYQGTPRSAEGQPIQWAPLDELEAIGLLEADRPMLEPLRAAYYKRS